MAILVYTNNIVMIIIIKNIYSVSLEISNNHCKCNNHNDNHMPMAILNCPTLGATKQAKLLLLLVLGLKLGILQED